MRQGILTAALTASLATAALGLPGDLVVLSDTEIRPNEAAGLFYLGQGGGGYLYNGSAAALGAVSPYRILDRDAEARDYYVVWAPEGVDLRPEAFAYLGAAVRLSDYEILVGLERGLGAGAIRAVERRVELYKLAPVTPVDFKVDAEEPPAEKDPRIEAAVNTLTADEYAGYIRTLQSFRTRYSNTTGCDAASYYLRNFFALQNLDASLFEFACVGFEDCYYPEAGKNIYVVTKPWALTRSRDSGGTWETINPGCLSYIDRLSWVNADEGFAIGAGNVLAITADGGDTWEKLEVAYSGGGREYHWRDVCFVSADEGWLAGISLRLPEYSDPRPELVRTTDGGRTWRASAPAEEADIYTIRFYDSDHGWAAEFKAPTSPGKIFYTDDAGETWRECTRPAADTSVWDLAAVGQAEAWAADSTNDLLHTTDGVTWEYVATGATGGLRQVEFPDRLHGYALHATLVATADGGDTWRTATALPETYYSALAFADKDHGVIGDPEGEYLLRTDDGAQSFEDIKGDMDLSCENVVGERRGTERPDEVVIIGGHYDSISGFPLDLAPGAEDNASGTACAMAAARAFRNVSFERTIRFMAFGDEENGCNGSYAYAAECAGKGENVVAVLNADMVSYDEEGGERDDLSVACSADVWLYEYLVRTGALYGNGLIYDNYEWGASDHRRFWDFRYPALGVIEGSEGQGGVSRYPYVHTTEDTFDKVDPAFGVRCARDLAAMLAHLAGVAGTFPDPPGPGHGTVPFARPFAVYPNPYCYASTTSTGVTFVGLKTPAKVEVYDLAGRRVARWGVAAGTDECAWCPAGSGEGALAPGVYVYRVEGVEQEKSGKIVIAR